MDSQSQPQIPLWRKPQNEMKRLARPATRPPCQSNRVNKVLGLHREITLGDGCTAKNGQDSFPTVALRPRNCLFSETDRPPIPGRYIAQYYRQTSYSLHGMQQPHQTVQIFFPRGIGLADWVTPRRQGTRALQTIVARLERGEGEFHASVPAKGRRKGPCLAALRRTRSMHGDWDVRLGRGCDVKLHANHRLQRRERYPIQIRWALEAKSHVR